MAKFRRPSIFNHGINYFLMFGVVFLYGIMLPALFELVVWPHVPGVDEAERLFHNAVYFTVILGPLFGELLSRARREVGGEEPAPFFVMAWLGLGSYFALIGHGWIFCPLISFLFLVAALVLHIPARALVRGILIVILALAGAFAYPARA